MGALDPVVIDHSFAGDPGATGMVDVAQLDEAFGILVQAIEAHSDLFGTLLRSDLTLADELIRLRNLHPEVVSALQLVAQASEGLHFIPDCKAASTANLVLSGTQTVDGVALVDGDLALVLRQTAPAENGLYVVHAGAWTRAAPADTWDGLHTAFVWVDGGAANAATGWACTAAAGGTLGIDPVGFTLVYRATRTLAQLDASVVPVTTPDVTVDSLLAFDVSVGAIRRFLLSALPFLPTSTTHNDLAGLTTGDPHTQYVKKAGDTLAGDIDAAGNGLVNLRAPMQPSDAATKAYVDEVVVAAAGFPVGFCGSHAGPTPPSGWLVMDGSVLLIADHSALGALLGSTFGGDGITTFGLPNQLGRAVIGAGAGAGLTARTLGATGGEETHLLVVNEIPSHHHTYTGLGGSPSSTGFGNSGNPAAITGNTGGGLAHNTMMPFLALLPIVKA